VHLVRVTQHVKKPICVVKQRCKYAQKTQPFNSDSIMLHLDFFSNSLIFINTKYDTEHIIFLPKLSLCSQFEEQKDAISAGFHAHEHK